MKTLLQKEKLLVLSNLSFCHDVFKSRLLQTRQSASICGKGLKTFQELLTAIFYAHSFSINLNLFAHFSFFTLSHIQRICSRRL